MLCFSLAHSALNQFEEARSSYRRALELDPSNESYKTYLEQADQKCKEKAVSDTIDFQIINLYIVVHMHVFSL